MVPKLCGQDIELGNFVMGTGRGRGVRRGGIARAAGAQSTGYPRAAPGAVPAGVPLSVRLRSRQIAVCGPVGSAGLGPEVARERRRAATSTCDHLELATAETTSAFDQVACTHAMLRVAQRALAAANAARPARRAHHGAGQQQRPPGQQLRQPRELPRDAVALGPDLQHAAPATSCTSRRSRSRASSSPGRARSAPRTARRRSTSSCRSAPTSSRPSSGRRPRRAGRS